MEIELLAQSYRLRVLRGHILHGRTEQALELLAVIESVTERMTDALEND